MVKRRAETWRERLANISVLVRVKKSGRSGLSGPLTQSHDSDIPYIFGETERHHQPLKGKKTLKNDMILYY